MATTKINLSETANAQIPHRAQILNVVSFLRTLAGLRPYSHSEVNQQHQKVTQIQEMTISVILHWCIFPAWEWMNFLNVFRKPSRHIFNFLHRISPGEITSLLGQITYQHFVQIFLFFLPTKSVLEFMRYNTGCTQWSCWAAFTALPGMLRREPSFALSLGCHREALAGRGWYPNTLDILGCWMLFTSGTP